MAAAMGMVHSKVSSTAPCTAKRQELTAGASEGFCPRRSSYVVPKVLEPFRCRGEHCLPKRVETRDFSILALTQV